MGHRTRRPREAGWFAWWASLDLDGGERLVEGNDAAAHRRAVEVDGEHADRLTRGGHGREVAHLVAHLKLRGDRPVAAPVEDLAAETERARGLERRRTDVRIVTGGDDDVAAVADREDERAER